SPEGFVIQENVNYRESDLLSATILPQTSRFIPSAFWIATKVSGAIWGQTCLLCTIQKGFMSKTAFIFLSETLYARFINNR
ncbi:hypothetical protein ABMA58_09620, partial [Oceanospirillum sp. HFRX-1_2]